MQTRRLGRTGLAVSRLGLGTMTWGRDTSPEEAAGQFSAFLEAGGTLVDTAASYGDGAAETILGRLLAGTDAVVSTKAGLLPAAGAERLRVEASRRSLLDSLDASLRRLGRDHVDVWQVHAWDPTTPVEETLAALDAAVSAGKARYVGLSNVTGWQAAGAASWQRAWPGRAPLACCQVEYSLLRRGVEAELLPAADHHGLGVLAWSPLAGGVLTGKYRHGTPSDARASSGRWGERLAPLLDGNPVRVVDAVGTAAEGLGVSPLAIALAWVRDRPGVSAALVGARTAAQLTAALDAERLELPPSIREALDDVSG